MSIPSLIAAPSVQVDATKLSQAEEKAFQTWRATLPGRLQYEGDYDLRGFWKKNPGWSIDQPEAHMTDEFKLPNHPTFSNESKYYGPATAHLGGTWDGDVYTPNDPGFKQRHDESPGAPEPGPPSPSRLPDYARDPVPRDFHAELMPPSDGAASKYANDVANPDLPEEDRARARDFLIGLGKR